MYLSRRTCCAMILGVLGALLATASAVAIATPSAAAAAENNELETTTIERVETQTDKVSSVVQTLKDGPGEVNASQVANVKIKVARYEGDQVLRVFTVNSKHRKKIKELEREGKVEKWASNTTSVDLFVKKEKVEVVKGTLNSVSMDFRVLLEDVQKAIDEENPPLTSDELNEFTTRKGHRLTFEHYHRMADLYSFLDYYASTKSNIVTVQTIGQSVEGRPIKVIKISSGKPNATAFWIDGGTHAREWITVSSVGFIINELLENRDSLEPELLDTDFYIVALMNPDGYEHAHEQERMWRKNRRRNFGAFCVGTDLNRNWGYEWGGQGSGKYPCQETYGGAGPFSEPETKAVSEFILQHASKMRAYVTFHSYGQYILYPWGYTKRSPPDVEDLDRVGRVAAAAMKQSGGATYTVGNSAALLYAAAGGADDWAKGAAKIKYAYTIELRDTGRHGFILPASYIKPVGKEAFAAIKAIAKEATA